MTTRWDPRVELARPPARRGVDWFNVLVWLGPILVFWGTILFLAWEVVR